MPRRKNEPNLAERVARQFNEWIIAQKLRPGDLLPSEAQLTEQFGVARSVVREALTRLRALGVIEVRHGHGTFMAELPTGLLQTRIRRFSHDSRERKIRDIVELYYILGTSSARLAAERHKPEDLADLRSALTSTGDALAQSKPAGEIVELFHSCLARASGNPLLEQIVTGLVQLLRAEHDAHWGGPKAAALYDVLGQLTREVEERHGDAARDVMAEYVRKVSRASSD